nr:hypothetical protein Iba_chr12bCG12090 [Ipomoea batatas]
MAKLTELPPSSKIAVCKASAAGNIRDARRLSRKESWWRCEVCRWLFEYHDLTVDNSSRSALTLDTAPEVGERDRRAEYTVSAVCSGTGRGETGCRILDNCKRKIGGDEERRLVHVFREQNVVADWLAQRSVVGSEERIVHNKPLLGCIKLVQNDRIGGVVVRYIHEEE